MLSAGSSVRYRGAGLQLVYRDGWFWRGTYSWIVRLHPQGARRPVQDPAVSTTESG